MSKSVATRHLIQPINEPLARTDLETEHKANHIFKEFLTDVYEAKYEKIIPKNASLSLKAIHHLPPDQRFKEWQRQQEALLKYGGRVEIRKIDKDTESEIHQRSFRIRYVGMRPKLAYKKAKSLDQERKLLTKPQQQYDQETYNQMTINKQQTMSKKFFKNDMMKHVAKISKIEEPFNEKKNQFQKFTADGKAYVCLYDNRLKMRRFFRRNSKTEKMMKMQKKYGNEYPLFEMPKKKKAL